jgi:hypothetical protein
MVDFERYMYLVNSPEYAYLEQNEPFSTLKVMICRKYSFQKLPQFSQENNVLDAPPLNTDGVHSGDTCISSTWVKSPTCSNISHSPHWKLWFAWHIPSKTNSILTGKQCAWCCSFLHRRFSVEWYIRFFQSVERPIWKKWAFLHLENCYLLGILLSKTNTILQANNVLESSSSNIDGCFGEIQRFL